ncbi:MAG TPA: hypothetical protein VMU69_09625 [Bradyrhizobium sp.]|nr:hypothetical protein [Bradyrhizobium sp.]
MRVLVLVVAMLILPTTSEASNSCMSKTEARKHFGLVHIYWHGADHCWDASSTRLHHLVVRRIEHRIDRPGSQNADRQDSNTQDSNTQDSNRQDSNRKEAKLQDADRREANQQDSKPQDSRQLKSPWQASMSQMMADDEPVRGPVQAPVQAPLQKLAQRSWADRWVDIEPAQLPLSDRWVDIAPVTPPPSRSAPDPELRMMVLGLVFIVVALMLAIIQVLFGAARGAAERDEAVA